MSIQGRLLEINIIGCRNLKDTEWISRQDPYVILEYANNKFRTKTDTDGGRNPSFNEKYTVPLIEGLQELNVQVWNSNTLTFDDFIGSGKIFLQKVLSAGYDDNSWPLSSKSGKRAGEIRVIMHYTNPKDKQHGAAMQSATSGQPGYPPVTASPYHAPPSAAPSYPAMQSAASGQPGYPPVYSPYNLPGQAPYSGPSMHGPGEYPPAPQHGPPPQYGNYPPQAYPPQAYPPQAYPPQTYPQYTYPPQPGYGAPPGAYPSYQGGCSHH